MRRAETRRIFFAMMKRSSRSDKTIQIMIGIAK